MPTDTELYKIKAFEDLAKRKESAEEQIDNAKLLVGEPMYFYCKSCGIIADVLPEDYLFTPHAYCSQCQGMKDEGLI